MSLYLRNVPHSGKHFVFAWTCLVAVVFGFAVFVTSELQEIYPACHVSSDADRVINRDVRH